jgi:hypothetical protein
MSAFLKPSGVVTSSKPEIVLALPPLVVLRCVYPSPPDSDARSRVSSVSEPAALVAPPVDPAEPTSEWGISSLSFVPPIRSEVVSDMIEDLGSIDDMSLSKEIPGQSHKPNVEVECKA